MEEEGQKIRGEKMGRKRERKRGASHTAKKRRGGREIEMNGKKMGEKKFRHIGNKRERKKKRGAAANYEARGIEMKPGAFTSSETPEARVNEEPLIKIRSRVVRYR